MRLETKFVQVPNDPQHINAINNLAAVWGWTVQNVQITDSKIAYEGDSHGWMTDYGYFGSTEIITEHTNYASITYQRDMDDPKYPQLTALEAAYNDCEGKQYLTDEEQKRLADAEQKVDKQRSKYQKLAIISVCISIVFSIIIKEFAVPILYGLIVMTYFLIKRSKTNYDNDSACRALHNLNDQRETEKKQAIVKKAQLI